MEFRFSQFLKVYAFIFVIPSGIVTDLRLVQPSKAYSSILVTLSGRVIVVMFLQSAKA